MRLQFGEAGRDYRGLWINDPDTGTKVRFGNISLEMAQEFYRQGNTRAGQEVMKKPTIGLWFSKEF